jgi:hypothetical protein
MPLVSPGLFVAGVVSGCDLWGNLRDRVLPYYRHAVFDHEEEKHIRVQNLTLIPWRTLRELISFFLS